MYKTLTKTLIATVLILTASGAEASDADCEGATNTRAIMNCMSAELREKEDILDTYLQEAFRKTKEDDSLDSEKIIAHLKQSQEHWEKNIKSYCDALYVRWIEGTVSGPYRLGCMKAMYTRRIHEIWADFIRVHPQFSYSSSLDEPERPRPITLPEEPIKGVSEE